MGQVEPPLVRELRKVVTELRERSVAQERHLEELRGAVVALMEPGMPRILRTPGGVMVLDKKKTATNEDDFVGTFYTFASTSPATDGPTPEVGLFHGKGLKCENYS